MRVPMGESRLDWCRKRPLGLFAGSLDRTSTHSADTAENPDCSDPATLGSVCSGTALRVDS